MKQIVNELYQCPMKPELRNHLLGLGFSTEDQAIITSLMEHDAESDFHYENTGICKERFERHLNRINRIIIPEIIRLANLSAK